MNKNLKIKGIVAKGKQRGKLLGFPTANIRLIQSIPEGVYISQTIISSTSLPSLSFVGKAETFNEDDVKLETYIFNFDEDLYEKEIIVELIKKIRNSQKFQSKEKLIEQMEKDKKEALEYFSDYV